MSKEDYFWALRCKRRNYAYYETGTLTTLRSTARHPAPGDRTPVPRPPHTRALGVRGDATADESQLRERGAWEVSPGDG